MVLSPESDGEKKDSILSCKENTAIQQQLITGRWADDLKTPFFVTISVSLLLWIILCHFVGFNTHGERNQLNEKDRARDENQVGDLCVSHPHE